MAHKYIRKWREKRTQKYYSIRKAEIFPGVTIAQPVQYPMLFGVGVQCGIHFNDRIRRNGSTPYTISDSGLIPNEKKNK